jgi:hypothetical protein
VLLTAAGTVNFAATGTISITTAGAKGLDANGTDMGAGSTFDDITVAGSASGGLSMVNTPGTTTFSNLTLTTTSGATGAFVLNNAGSVTVPGGGTSNVSATGGPAIDVTGATTGVPLPTVSLAFDTVSSTNSSGRGISLNTLGLGTLSATGGTLTGFAGIAFSVTGGSGTITYAGNISDGAGNTALISGRTGAIVTLSGTITDGADAGGGISVTSNAGGSTLFSGSAKTISTTGTNAVSLTSNTGHAVSFTGGGLALTTTSGVGLSATGGGTVSVTGASNTISATTAPGLTIDNTTIGASGITFQRISVSGGANGIVLNTTGSSGGLSVTGTGTAGTGGTIQNTTSDSISLTSTGSVQLDRMIIANSGESGILGSTVNGLAMTGTSLTNNGNDAADDGIRIANLTGANAWSAITVSGSARNGVFIDNTAGTMSSLNVTGASAFNNASAAFGANGFLVDIHGTAVLTSGMVDGATFSGNKPARGITVQAQDTGTISSLTVQNSTFTNDGIGASFEQAHSANHTFNFLNNTITGSAPGQGVNAFSSATATGGTLTGKISGNSIGTAGVLDSGSTTGMGIRVFGQSATAIVMTISNNTIREVPNGRGIDITAVGTTSGGGGARFKVTGNTIVRPSGTNQDIGCGFHVPCPLASIFVTSDSFGAAETVCSVITGNTAYDPTSWPVGGEAAYTLGETFDAGHSSTHQIEGSGASVATSILASNTVTNSASAPTQIDAGVSLVPVGTCGSFP